MSKEKLLENIAKELVYLKEFQKHGVTKIPIEDKLLIKEIYKEIAPHIQVNLTCDSCIIGYLNSMLSYYEREKPRLIATQLVEFVSKQDVIETLKTTSKIKKEKPLNTINKKQKNGNR